MFELPDIDFSELYCSDELEAVGLEDINDLVKPAIIAFLKDGIQRHIIDCDLSTTACNELITAFRDEGFEIKLDKGVRPNANALPTSFSEPNTESDEDNQYDTEHQRALNYASWVLEKTDLTAGRHSLEIETAYPLNLLSAIFGESREHHFHSPELCVIIQDEFDNLLDTLSPAEENILRAMYQSGITSDDIVFNLGLQDNAVVTWAIHTLSEILRSKTLRKLRHPSRSKKLRDALTYIAYLENVDGATLDSIRNSFLHEKSLSWEPKPEGDGELERKIIATDWNELKYGSCFERVMDINAFPVKLILNAEHFGWCSWPTGLLMGTALTTIFPNQVGAAVQKAFFSTNTILGHFLLVIGQFSGNKEFCELFELTEGVLSRVQVDELTLKNLYRIIEETTPEKREPESLRTLYDAEQRYCNRMVQQVSDPREKEFYKMFLELIKDQLNNLPQESGDKILAMTIEELDFGSHTFFALKRANINTVKDLISMTEADLKRVRNLGRKSREEIICKVEALGFGLRSDNDP